MIMLALLFHLALLKIDWKHVRLRRIIDIQCSMHLPLLLNSCQVDGVRWEDVWEYPEFADALPKGNSFTGLIKLFSNQNELFFAYKPFMN